MTKWLIGISGVCLAGLFLESGFQAIRSKFKEASSPFKEGKPFDYRILGQRLARR